MVFLDPTSGLLPVSTTMLDGLTRTLSTVNWIGSHLWRDHQSRALIAMTDIEFESRR